MVFFTTTGLGKIYFENQRFNSMVFLLPLALVKFILELKTKIYFCTHFTFDRYNSMQYTVKNKLIHTWKSISFLQVTLPKVHQMKFATTKGNLYHSIKGYAMKYIIL